LKHRITLPQLKNMI